MSARLQGKVKFFNAKKGFGFIEGPSEGKDIFLHFTQIQMDGYKTLNTADLVEYELVNGDKGIQAGSVTLVKAADETLTP